MKPRRGSIPFYPDRVVLVAAGMLVGILLITGMVLVMSGCAYTVTTIQHFPDGSTVTWITNEAKPSILNSAVLTSSLATAGTGGDKPQTYVGVGQSVAEGVGKVAAVAARAAPMAKRKQQWCGCENVDCDPQANGKPLPDLRGTPGCPVPNEKRGQ
jgi:hypothetical protein